MLASHGEGHQAWGGGGGGGRGGDGRQGARLQSVHGAAAEITEAKEKNMKN